MIKYKFDSYIMGLMCLLFVCILPAVSPTIYFINSNQSVMPYLLIGIAIAGILYEFYIPKGEVGKFLKCEQIIVYIWSFLFIAFDLIVLFMKADKGVYNYNWIDYSLMAYTIIPIIVVIVETYRSAVEYARGNANNNNNRNTIASGKAIDV